MRILYVLYFNIKETAHLGVAKKIGYQLRAMRSLGHDVDIAYCADDNLIIENGSGDSVSYKAKAGKTHYRKSVKEVLRGIATEYDLIYIRYPGSIDYYIEQTFKTLHAMGKKVVLEMPTYPIGGEMMDILKNLKNNHEYVQLAKRCIVYGIHRVLSRRISSYLTCIVSCSEADLIWGTRVINIENGIDCDAVSIQDHKQHKNDEINLIFVAVFAVWHGLDRLIYGLNEYYEDFKRGNPIINLTLVGQSEELERVISLKVFSQVAEHINVLGAVFGSDLDEEYNKADIAVSSLGMHRIGLKSGSTLKTREYCAKGIPFIYGYEEKGIDDDFPFAMRIPATEEPVNLLDVVDFYKGLQGKEYSQEMHEFSRKYDWKTQMKHFFEELASIEGRK